MSTYLSRLSIDSRSVTVRRDLSDCVALHRTILSAFPTAMPDVSGARARFGVLYRVEPEGERGRRKLLVQSDVTPTWGRLPEAYLLEPPECKCVDDYYDQLELGAVLRFRLRANPTKRISGRNEKERDPSRWSGRRVELRGEAEQLDWLRRKAVQSGFELLEVPAHPGVPDVRSTPEANATGRRSTDGADTAARLTFGAVLFYGRLRISEVGAFRKALSEGIGSGKAYGFGLLSVAPVHRANGNVSSPGGQQ